MTGVEFSGWYRLAALKNAFNSVWPIIFFVNNVASLESKYICDANPNSMRVPFNILKIFVSFVVEPLFASWLHVYKTKYLCGKDVPVVLKLMRYDVFSPNAACERVDPAEG